MQSINYNSTNNNNINELRKSLLLNCQQENQQNQQKNNIGNNNDEEEFQEIEIPIDDHYSIKEDSITEIKEKKITIDENNNNNNNNGNNINLNNHHYNIDIDSDNESDIVDYKTIQPGVLKAKNKVVLVLVTNKNGSLSLNAKYPRELSHCLNSADYLQIKSEINSFKSQTDSIFNRLIVAFSVVGAICIIASLLLWYINNNFITIGGIVCLVVGVLFWLIFGLIIEIKNHYRIKNRKIYFKELNQRFEQNGIRFRTKYDKTRYKNPIALIIEYPQYNNNSNGAN